MFFFYVSGVAMRAFKESQVGKLVGSEHVLSLVSGGVADFIVEQRQPV